MIVLTRSEFVRMIVRQPLLFRSEHRADSASNCPAWLIAAMGFRISCAMLALSRAKRRELRLLYAFGEQARVFEEDQNRRRRLAAKWREVGLHDA